MESYMTSMDVGSSYGSTTAWKRDAVWPTCEISDYNNYRKPNFQEIPVATEATAAPGFTDSNAYMATLMDIYNLSVSGGCHELMDLSDFNSIGDMVNQGPPHHGSMPLPPQNDVVLPFNSGFAQPLADQNIMASLNRPYEFPSPGLSPDHLASQFSSFENTRNDMTMPANSGTFPDFADIDTDSNMSSSLEMDEAFATLRTLLVTSPEQTTTRGRSLSDGVLQLRSKRATFDRRYSDASNNRLETESHSKEFPSKKARYFWQYNLQAKGPKREIRPKKLNLLRNAVDDPHILKQPDDPVFDPAIVKETEWKGICVQHTGKARRGNGNDLTADPKKLFMIGQELDDLNGTISSVMASLEMTGGKQSARREKNKLTSRVCRLKKKAQHEANKIKLSGLHEEHRELMKTLQEIRGVMTRKAAAIVNGYGDNASATTTAKVIREQNLRTFVCGRSMDYVNDQIEKTKKRHFKTQRPGMRQRALT